MFTIFFVLTIINKLIKIGRPLRPFTTAVSAMELAKELMHKGKPMGKEITHHQFRNTEEAHQRLHHFPSVCKGGGYGVRWRDKNECNIANV